MEEIAAEEKSASENYHSAYIAFLNGQASQAELAEQEKKWQEATAKRVDSTNEYNVAVATLQYSIGF